MASATDGEVQSFLQECSQSSDAAYNALKSLLEELHLPPSRPRARRFFSSVQKLVDSVPEYAENSLSLFHFRIHSLSLAGYEG